MSEAGDMALGIDPEELLAHAEWLRRLAVALVGDGDAEDLAQQALEVALSRPPARPGPLRPWLGGVARNLARATRRGDRRRARREEAASIDPGGVPGPEALLERAELQQRVARAVLELSEPYRSTVLLRFYEGLSSAEIARRVGIPAGTVRWRLARGLEELRAVLDREAPRRWQALLAPLVGADALPAASVAKGALVVKTALTIAAAILALLATYLGGRHLGWWGGEAAPAATGSATPTEPPRRPDPAGASAGPRLAEAAAISEADPTGELRLEGQVIDGEERPIGGATVAIDSHPRRTARTEGDGSFAFDGLIGRDYTVVAATDEGTAGPVHLRLSATSEPVILRVNPAGAIEITVVEAKRGAPIAGAEVELRGLLTRRAVSGQDGVARLVAVDAREPTIRVEARGYAPASLRLIARPTAAGEARRERVELRRGAAVSGRVTEGGEPVSGARVVAIATSEPFPVVDRFRDGVASDARGRWTLPALAPGTYRFVATAPGRAPAESSPITVDGDHAREGVELELDGGAVLSGTVETSGGDAVAGADVRVVAHGSLPWRPVRRAYTDAAGHFELRGLRRLPVDVVASHELGASPIAAIDLGRESAADVELTLSVGGAIAGVVMGPDGAPLPEAQVAAEPVWSGARGERAAWVTRGTPFRVADAGGRFSFTGLPAGRYRLRAARPGVASALWLDPGVVAATGDADVVLAVAAPGRIRGRVEVAGGEDPGPFTAALGYAAPVPFSTPEFEIEAPPGVQVVRFAGPGFVPKDLDVTVEAGEVADLGAVTLERGRSVSGRVLDAAGAPVAGAEVAAGLLLTGDGSKLFVDDESIGARHTTTGDDGRFALSGFGPTPLTVVAGKAGVGRSPSIELPAGQGGVAVDLVLAATGGLAGAVREDGQPLADTVIIANPIGAARSSFFVVTGADGRFAFDALSPGDYLVQVLQGGGGPKPKDLHIQRAAVTAGERGEVDIAFATGSAELSVRVMSDAGEPAPLAQVLLLAADVDLESGGDLRRGNWLDRVREARWPLALYMRGAAGAAAEIARLQPGGYTACAIPLPVDPGDPAAMREIQGRMGELPRRCVGVAVRASPPKQALDIEVPAAWTRPAD